MKLVSPEKFWLRRVMAGAFCVLGLLIGRSSPISADASKALTAIFLVAKPDLREDSI